MNTIHSSSLTHYPVAFNKPQAGVASENGLLAEGIGKPQQTQVSGRPSTPEQIKTALDSTGLSNMIANLPTNLRAQKALNAYTQNNNQTAQHQITQLVTGIDLFA